MGKNALKIYLIITSIFCVFMIGRTWKIFHADCEYLRSLSFLEKNKIDESIAVAIELQKYLPEESTYDLHLGRFYYIAAIQAKKAEERNSFLDKHKEFFEIARKHSFAPELIESEYFLNELVRGNLNSAIQHGEKSLSYAYYNIEMRKKLEKLFYQNKLWDQRAAENSEVILKMGENEFSRLFVMSIALSLKNKELAVNHFYLLNNTEWKNKKGNIHAVWNRIRNFK